MKEQIHTITGINWYQQVDGYLVLDWFNCGIEDLGLMFCIGGFQRTDGYYLYVNDVFAGRGKIEDLWSEWLHGL